MRAQLLARGVSIGLRVLAMLSRFLLILFLAKTLPPNEVGLFGLLLATISFSVLLIGGDFYTYSQRILLSKPKMQWGFILYNQAAAISIIYILLLPLHILIFYFGLIPHEYINVFFLLLITEHVAQETNRILIAMKRPVIASIVLFVRSGLWGYILIAILWLQNIDKPLLFTLNLWLISVIFAIFIGGYFIYQEITPWKKQQKLMIDIEWIKLGFKTAVIYLISTLCFRALFTVDKYVVGYLTGQDILGVYTIYIGIAMSILSFIDAGILSFLYPNMVNSYKQGNYQEYKKHKKELTISVILSSIILAIIAAILAPTLLSWIEKEIYLNYLPLLWILLLTIVIYAIGMIPHYGLYARNQDKVIVFSHIMSLFFFAITTVLVSFISPVFATAIGLLIAFIWMALFKQWNYKKMEKLNPQS